MELETAFGHILKKFRKEAFLTQEALALNSNLDRTYISLLERGLRQPTLKTLFRLSDVLEIHPFELVAAVEKLLKVSCR